jgi:hypothetical protein
MPLANIIDLRIFKLGEVVLREGSPASHFYIINKGRVKIIKEEVIVRDTKTLGVHKQLKKRRFKFGYKDCKIFFHLINYKILLQDQLKAVNTKKEKEK